MSKIVAARLFTLFALSLSFPAWADYGSLWSLVSVDPDYQSAKKCGKDAFVVISWNVSNFGGDEPPKRIEMVSNVLRHAEMAFILEVSASFQGPKAVAVLHDALMRKGAKWQYSVSNPSTPEPAGKHTSERIAFLWKDSPSLKLGANSAELVTAIEKTVAREPITVWAIGRKIGKAELIAFHARPEGSGAHEEGAAIANYARTVTAGHQKGVQTVVLGDFNLSKDKLDPLFVPIGFRSGISGATTLRKDGEGLSKKRDNAYFNGEGVCEAGRIRTDKLFGTDSVRASDHLPIYVAFEAK